MLYWFSHEGPVFGGPAFAYRFPSNSILFSIVLDHGARYAFRAIRFVVVYKPSASIDQPRITRSLYLKNAVESPFRTRQRINRDISRATKSETSHPICNIIFEAVHGADPFFRKQCIALVPYTAQPIPETPLILFEQLSRIDSTKPALNIYLDCTLPFISHGSYGYVPAYSVRILSVADHRDAHSWANLDPELIFRIVDLVIQQKPKGWRPMLLNYGLVCKSWSHVLSLFFTLINTAQRVDARYVARALDAKPHYGALIPELYAYDLKFTDSEDLVWWGAFLRILQLATSVRKIFMSVVPLSLADEAARHLSALRQVQTFRMSRMSDDRHKINVSDASKTIAMSTIQYFMSSWEKLSYLDLQEWADEDDYQTAPDVTSCSFQLAFLMLVNGTMTGSQLLYFISPTPSTLLKLVLSFIKGLTNADFTVFLNAVAPSLENLRLEGCTFPKASSSEELALDATISKMNLKMAHVNTNHISILTLSRKNDMELHPGAMLIIRSDKYEPRGPGDQSLVDDVVTFFIEGNRTGWRFVDVRRYTAELTHPQSLVDMSIAAAKVNGAALYFYTSD